MLFLTWPLDWKLNSTPFLHLNHSCSLKIVNFRPVFLLKKPLLRKIIFKLEFMKLKNPNLPFFQALFWVWVSFRKFWVVFQSYPPLPNNPSKTPALCFNPLEALFRAFSPPEKCCFIFCSKSGEKMYHIKFKVWGKNVPMWRISTPVGKKEENLEQVIDLKILVELNLAGGTGLKWRTSTNFLQAKTRRECNSTILLFW